MRNAKSILVAVAGVVAAAAVSFGAFARPLYGYEITYYADPAMTEVAGSKDLTCGGRVISYGTVTPYYDTVTFKCN